MREDVHSPKNLVTEDYEYIWAFDRKQPFVFGNPFALDIARKLARSERPHDGNDRCDHCGAHIRYVAVLRHIPTDNYITVGETCMDNRFERASADFHKMRKQAVLDQKAQRIKKAKEQFAADNPDLAWMLSEDGENWPAGSIDNPYIADVAMKLSRYGELSERQIEAVRRSVERDAARKVEQDAEIWVQVPETGRVEVTGTVLATKVQEGFWGDQLKMLLQVGDTATGAWKLWTTVPSKFDNVQRGDVVTIKVTLGQSETDDSFAFGSRPTGIRHEKDEG